jgi:hypothetical protein
MAFGQATIAAHFTPERSTLPHEPLSMTIPTKARQLPSFEFGKPPKLQPQPKSQLQNAALTTSNPVAVVVMIRCRISYSHPTSFDSQGDWTPYWTCWM